MNLIDRMERSKLGRFGIPGLMKYVIAINLIGTILNLVNPNFYFEYLRLDVNAVLHGQVWRLLTFVLCPSDMISGNTFVNLVWFAVWAFVYYSIGTNLERMWGTFRFNLFYLGGLFWFVLMTFVFYFVMRAGVLQSAYVDYLVFDGMMEYLNQTLFLAFAFTFPNAQILFYFVIPVKAKWFSIVYLVMDGWTMIVCLRNGMFYSALILLAFLLNFFLFYLMGRGSSSPRQVYQQKKRQAEYKRKAAPKQMGPRHRCVVCGRTELDAPQLEFRFCSKCEGNFEYCSDHIFTHEHVRHDEITGKGK